MVLRIGQWLKLHSKFNISISILTLALHCFVNGTTNIDLMISVEFVGQIVIIIFDSMLVIFQCSGKLKIQMIGSENLENFEWNIE